MMVDDKINYQLSDINTMDYPPPANVKIPKDSSMELIVLILNNAGLTLNNDSPELRKELEELGATLTDA